MIKNLIAVLSMAITLIGSLTIADASSAPSHPHVAIGTAMKVTRPTVQAQRARVARWERAHVAHLRKLERRRERAARASRSAQRLALAPAVQWAHSPEAVAVSNCESGGNAHVVASNGHYGKWQFALSTWYSVGGQGNPAYASEAEQDYRAWLLWRRDGWGQWQCAGIVGVSP